ncbi:MAG: ethanolamine ammonia-lyase subunit EutC [Sphingobacteriaceae bacterium]|nr:MAG: ethanolamine ammonia-lyase subunit EutC [Sphingobacteriaceae bacterium]
MRKKEVQTNATWRAFQNFTNARIAIGRTGHSIPVKRLLEFKLAHAHARDAVYSKLNTEALAEDIKQFNLPVLQLQSLVTYREQYLQRPDLGRKLNEQSFEQLKEYNSTYDLVIIITDGLSATATNQHAVGLLQYLLPYLTRAGLQLAPLCITEQGRVAISDDVAAVLKAKMSLILIGERPGLSAADSLGAYITYDPQPGLTDEARNCVSNIRPGGLKLQQAADRIYYLIQQSLQRKLSGVDLKDDTGGKYFP